MSQWSTYTSLHWGDGINLGRCPDACWGPATCSLLPMLHDPAGPTNILVMLTTPQSKRGPNPAPLTLQRVGQQVSPTALQKGGLGFSCLLRHSSRWLGRWWDNRGGCQPRGGLDALIFARLDGSCWLLTLLQPCPHMHSLAQR